ncbi:MAG: DUF896 domain-containing protein [Clostridia bacterium]|nr:DUF896 domain-containing protein [Clostridia bacterium]
MEQKEIDRINELTRLSRERELNAQEQAERQTLRARYLAQWRKSAVAALNSVVVIEPDGTKHKLAKKGQA